MRHFVVWLLTLGFLGEARAQDVIVFFSDNPGSDDYYSSSWGYCVAPSVLELKGNNDKFPVDAGHPYSGAHSLRLHWNSKSGGDWGIAIASPGWPAYDFTQYDSIVYWLNGPEAIENEDLPDLAIEDMSNKVSSRVGLGIFLDGLDNDSTTWQRISIPRDAFEPGPNATDFTRIKTIYHFQRDDDGIDHTFWIDEIRIKKQSGGDNQPPAAPNGLTAEGHESRIDLQWDPSLEPDVAGYWVYRSSSLEGPFVKVNASLHENHVYSDFLGENDRTCFYKVSALNQGVQESPLSETASATSVAMDDEALLSSVQKAAFRYFYDYGHPTSGLARERKGSGDVCASGGTGFGLLTLMVGAERSFVDRDSVAARVLKIVRFLQDHAVRYYGAWPHWIDGVTGSPIPFSEYDDGADIVETAYLVEGLLAVRQYFDSDDAVESEIRLRATQLWEEVEWDWFRRYPTGNYLYWHWSPNVGWKMNMPIIGFNECMIVYLLAIASPTHPVPPELYTNGWAGSYSYSNGNVYYGYEQWVGPPYGGPLFFTHYSFVGFDPRDKEDAFCNYLENNRNISLINRAYCIDNPKNHTGYSDLVWGLTASDDPWGYMAHEPNAGAQDNGTITPTAALSAFPYTPDESMATLKHFYYNYGPRLWGEFGFRDAFNLDEDWFATSTLAIDQGTIAPMIENFRTGLCWDCFMANPEIDSMLSRIGWIRTGVENPSGSEKTVDALRPNYPNPFNAATAIRFSLKRNQTVRLDVFTVAGTKVATILDNERMEAGAHQVVFQANGLGSGVYVVRLSADTFRQTLKMVLIK